MCHAATTSRAAYPCPGLWLLLNPERGPLPLLDPERSFLPSRSPSSVCPERRHPCPALFLLPRTTQSQRMRAGTDSVQGGGVTTVRLVEGMTYDGQRCEGRRRKRSAKRHELAYLAYLAGSRLDIVTIISSSPTPTHQCSAVAHLRTDYTCTLSESPSLSLTRFHFL